MNDATPLPELNIPPAMVALFAVILLRFPPPITARLARGPITFTAPPEIAFQFPPTLIALLAPPPITAPCPAAWLPLPPPMTDAGPEAMFEPVTDPSQPPQASQRG